MHGVRQRCRGSDSPRGPARLMTPDQNPQIFATCMVIRQGCTSSFSSCDDSGDGVPPCRPAFRGGVGALQKVHLARSAQNEKIPSRKKIFSAFCWGFRRSTGAHCAKRAPWRAARRVEVEELMALTCPDILRTCETTPVSKSLLMSRSRRSSQRSTLDLNTGTFVPMRLQPGATGRNNIFFPSTRLHPLLQSFQAFTAKRFPRARATCCAGIPDPRSTARREAGAIGGGQDQEFAERITAA
jgi:hypothetical protein